jgi:hypothetical protein
MSKLEELKADYYAAYGAFSATASDTSLFAWDAAYNAATYNVTARAAYVAAWDAAHDAAAYNVAYNAYTTARNAYEKELERCQNLKN